MSAYRRPIRVVRAISLCTLALISGCKTSTDAAAAATQMSATAKSLSDYYTAVNTLLANTDLIYKLNQQIDSKPYTPQNQQKLKDNEAELAKRAALASDFSNLAAEFAKLTSSTAPADVAASATKLETECDTLASVKVSSGEQNMLKSALQLFVTAMQEHKEREAAKAMDTFAKGLSDLFVKEEPIWNSIEEVNSQVASTLAGDLVKQSAVDNSGLLKVALTPFELTPAVPTGALNAQLAVLANQQIVTGHASLDLAYQKATDAMAKSLDEMSQRIHLVATDSPMAFRLPPPTVADVEKWTTQILSY